MTRRPFLALAAIAGGGALLAAGCRAPAEVKSPEILRRADEQFLSQQYASAAAGYEAFLTENASHGRKAEILGRIGKCQLALERPDPAVRKFDQALAEGAEGAVRGEILFRRAVALRMAGDNRLALEGFRAVAALTERERGVTTDELRYEYAVSLFRGGEWKAGHEQLGSVSSQGPFATKKYTLQGVSAFTVQVGAFTDEKNARLQADKYQAHVRAVPTDKPLYIVTAGAFARYEDAQREAERLKRQGASNAFVIP